MPLEGDRKPKRLLSEDRKANSENLAFSPDARWIAYAYQVRAGRYEIFVEPFPATGARYQVSTNSGDDPVWSPDGHRLYYFEPQSLKLVAVDLKTAPAFSFSSPMPLNFPQIDQVGDSERSFDISPDGKRFIVVLQGSDIQTGRRPAEQINFVLNWFQELKQRVPLR